MRKRPFRIPENHHAGRTLLYGAAGVLLVLMITGAAYPKDTLNTSEIAEPVPTNPVVSLEQITTAEKEPTFQTTEVDFSLPQMENDEKEIVNILLIGQDNAAQSSARSDTIILCTFNKKSDTITMTSFLRDLYVKIPGHKRNRINAAFNFGGTELLNETLHENFGIEVDGNIQVDFSRFEQIIDMLGGITMDLTAAEAAYINKHLPGCSFTEGTHLLNGEQALTYARDRYDVDGDFSRTNRQRKLLNVLVDTYKSKNLKEMLQLMREITPMITTDISKSDMTGYALTLFPMLASAQLRTQAIPVDGGYSYQTIGGMSVLVPDLEKNIQALEESLA
ncbi:MAG: LCP family protein [Oscillospiraceae bacterium]|nr:LCP family protein [Oscillospiraceae bacterium]